MRPFIEELSARVAACFVSIYPNAGLPNEMGGYDETAEMMTDTSIRLCRACGFINIVGGCCGTTPAHIKKISADQLQNLCSKTGPCN
jgi:5-methyltetrahydrofolate--homocysteine methyltransferase